MWKSLTVTVSIIALLTAPAFFTAGCEQDTLEYEVSLEVVPEGAGEVAGGGTYLSGEEVTVEATLEEGYEFVGWKENGERVSTDNTYRFQIENNRELTANFELDWPTAEIEETAKKALAVYWHQSPPGALVDDAADARADGRLKLNYPGLSEFSEEAEIHINDIIHGKDRVEVEASLEYPCVEKEDFKELEEKILREITETAEQGPVSLRAAFTRVLQEHDLSRETTTKTVAIEKREEQTGQDGTTEEQLKAVEIDPPEELFSSLDTLYRETVAARVEEVTAETGEDRVFKARDDTARAVFDGQDITLEAHGLHCRTVDPYYLLEETGIILPENGKRLALAALWEEITGQRGHCPYSKHTPAEYFSWLEFGEDTQHDRLTVHLTAPYFAATQSSTIGYIDMETLEANLFLNTSGRPGSELYWCPEGRRAAYCWTQMGSGFSKLDVYDLQSEKLIEVASLDKFVELVGEGYIGDFKNLEWSEDSRYLYFTTGTGKTAEADESGDDVAESETISWKLDVEKEELVIRD